MNIYIQSINFSVDSKLISFVRKKIHKLFIIYDSIIKADIYLIIDKPESYYNKIVEIKLHSSGGQFFVKKQSNSFEESAELASQALRKQIIKNKKKQNFFTFPPNLLLKKVLFLIVCVKNFNKFAAHFGGGQFIKIDINSILADIAQLARAADL